MSEKVKPCDQRLFFPFHDWEWQSWEGWNSEVGHTGDIYRGRVCRRCGAVDPESVYDRR